jgi:tetratricopeptide (TPR) repeat protein
MTAKSMSCGADFLRVRSVRWVQQSIVFFFLLALFTTVCSWAQSEESFARELDRARGLAERGDRQQAEHIYLQLAKREPGSYEVHNDLGALYLAESRYPVACDQFGLAVGINPKSAVVFQNLGICRIRTREIARAVESLQKAEILESDDLKTRYLLAECYKLLGNRVEAIRELEYIRVSRPRDASVLSSLVRLYRDEQDKEKAIGTFHALVEVAPDSVLVHVLMAESYDLQGNPKDAMGEMQKAIALEPQAPRLHFALGFLLWSDNRLDEAVSEFQKELEINPHSAPSTYYLADIALTRNQYDLAEKLFRQVVDENGGCVDAHLSLGKVYVRLNELEPALQELKRAESLDGRATDVHYWLATTYQKMGRRDEHLSEMKAFLALNNNMPERQNDQKRNLRMSSTCGDIAY